MVLVHQRGLGEAQSPDPTNHYKIMNEAQINEVLKPFGMNHRDMERLMRKHGEGFEMTEKEHAAAEAVVNLLAPANKSCDGCTVCCEAPAIEKHQIVKSDTHLPEGKPANVKCAHCTVAGCGVYDSKPQVCSGYRCLWTMGLSLVDPKDSGAALSFQPVIVDGKPTNESLLIAHCRSIDAALSNSKLMHELISAIQSVASFAILRDDKRAFMLCADGSTREVDINQEDYYKVEVLPLTEREGRWTTL